ncbi:hypothetical protein PG995_012909 [Apiospora arundinis]
MSSPRLTTSFITCEPFLPTDCHTTQRRVCSYVCISPNMELPAENGVHVWRCAVVMPCITLLFVVARFYSRIALMKKGLGKDDYIIGITFVFLVAYSILIAIAASNGLGLHSRQYTDDTLSRYYKYVGIATEMSLLASMGFKMSLLLLYLKLAGSKRKLQWTVYAAMVWVVDWLIANMVAGGMQCWPRDKKWEKDEMGWCVQSNAVGVVFGAGNVSSNLLLAMIPVALIWRKRLLRMQERIEFGVVVSSGLLAFSFAVADWAVAIHTLNVEDKTWWTGVRFVLSIFEVHTGMLCACIAGASQLLSAPRPAAPETIPTINYWPSPSAPSLQQTLQSRNQSFQTWQSLVSPVSSYPSSIRTATPLPIQVEFEGAQSRDQRSLRAQREVKSIYELDGSVVGTPSVDTGNWSPSLLYETPTSQRPVSPGMTPGHYGKKNSLGNESFLFDRKDDYDEDPQAVGLADLEGYWGPQQPPPYSPMPATRIGPVSQRAATPTLGTSNSGRRLQPHIATAHLKHTPSMEELAKAHHIAAQMKHATKKHTQSRPKQQQQQQPGLSPMPIPQHQSQHGSQRNRSPIQASPTLGPWQTTGIAQVSQSSNPPRGWL